MATLFLSLCHQILTAASSVTPYDASKTPLCTLLNDMTKYVATVSHIDNEDETVVHGYVRKLVR